MNLPVIFQWKDVKNFPTIFFSFMLGDVNSMYILRGTLIYVKLQIVKGSSVNQLTMMYHATPCAALFHQ